MMDARQREQAREATSWKPLLTGGANFRNFRLDFSKWGRIDVVPTLVMRLLALPFLAGGCAAAGVGLAEKQPVAVAAGAFFLLIAAIVIAKGWRRKGLFDLDRETYQARRQSIDFSRIAALQVIREQCHGKNGPYPAWELNLVLEDGDRVNILDHGNFKTFAEDTGKLAEALHLEVWDQHGLWNPESEGDERQDGPGGAAAKAPPAKGGGCLVIFGLFFAGIPVTALAMLGILPLARTAASANWQECPATVIESTLEHSRGSRGGATYRIRIRAQYEWEGRQYVCEKHDFFRGNAYTNIGVGAMRWAVEELSPGTVTTCLVNPKAPEQSVMRRDVPVSFLVVLTLFTLPFLGVGGWLAIHGLKG